MVRSYGDSKYCPCSSVNSPSKYLPKTPLLPLCCILCLSLGALPDPVTCALHCWSGLLWTFEVDDPLANDDSDYDLYCLHHRKSCCL